MFLVLGLSNKDHCNFLLNSGNFCFWEFFLNCLLCKFWVLNIDAKCTLSRTFLWHHWSPMTVDVIVRQLYFPFLANFLHLKKNLTFSPRFRAENWLWRKKRTCEQLRNLEVLYDANTWIIEKPMNETKLRCFGANWVTSSELEFMPWLIELIIRVPRGCWCI